MFRYFPFVNPVRQVSIYVTCLARMSLEVGDGRPFANGVFSGVCQGVVDRRETRVGGVHFSVLGLICDGQVYFNRCSLHAFVLVLTVCIFGVGKVFTKGDNCVGANIARFICGIRLAISCYDGRFVVGVIRVPSDV